MLTVIGWIIVLVAIVLHDKYSLWHYNKYEAMRLDNSYCPPLELYERLSPDYRKQFDDEIIYRIQNNYPLSENHKAIYEKYLKGEINK